MTILTPCLTDNQFIRGNVPMTKEEVRHLSVCKLQLTPDAVVYDIGCGTGSVTAEIARLSDTISVYGIDCNDEALKLTEQNARQLECGNITVVRGMAPEALSSLPPATHAFIGGTKGNLRPILAVLQQKNPAMRVVINAVSMESIAEITTLLHDLPVTDDSVVQVGISRTTQLGNYHLLQAQNPVYIFAFTFATAHD